MEEKLIRGSKESENDTDEQQAKYMIADFLSMTGARQGHTLMIHYDNDSPWKQNKVRF